MLGIIVQLIISGLLLWLFQKKNHYVLGFFLGFFPTRRRIGHFMLFLLVTASCCTLGFLMKMYFAKQQWVLNPNLNESLIWKGIEWNLKSVLFEELIFRGAIFYILIQRIGARKAIIISAIGFGIYHWFSYGILGNWLQMAIIFFVTGAMGLVLAYGFAKSKSLYIPIAIHFGWNYTQQSIFSSGPIGKQILIPVLPHSEVTVSYVTFFCILLLPMILMLGINYWIIRKMKKVEE
jgi:membrane protease YdiL (CAAX protease family)